MNSIAFNSDQYSADDYLESTFFSGNWLYSQVVKVIVVTKLILFIFMQYSHCNTNRNIETEGSCKNYLLKTVQENSLITAK